MAISVQYLFLKLRPQCPGLKLLRPVGQAAPMEGVAPERTPNVDRFAELPQERGYKGDAVIPDGSTLWAAERLEPGEEPGTVLADGLLIRLEECPAFLVFADEAPMWIPALILLAPAQADHFGIYREIWRILNENTRWQMDVSRELLQRQGPDGLLRLTFKLLGNPVYIADANFMMIRSAGVADEEGGTVLNYQIQHGYLPFEVLMKLIHTGELSQINDAEHAIYMARSQCFRRPFVIKTIHMGAEILGYFVIIEKNEDLTEVDLEIADRLGDLLSDAPEALVPWLRTESFLYEHFLLDIMKGGLVDQDSIQHQLREFGWDVRDDYRLMVIHKQNADSLINHNLISVFAADWDARGFTYKDSLVIVYHGPARYMDRLKVRLPELFQTYHVRGAMSEEFFDFTQIKAYYRQAVRALEFSRVRKDAASVPCFEDYYLLYRALVMSEKLPVFSVVEKMLAFDRENGTEYCATLYEYLLSGNNVVAAAKTLYLHRNTMNYRMNKIQELFGLDLERPEIRERCLDSLGPLMRYAKELAAVSSE